MSRTTLPIAPPVTAPHAVDMSPSSPWWDDFDTATVRAGDRTLAIELYGRPAPGRIPAGAMVLGRPLYVRVIETSLDDPDAVELPRPVDHGAGPGPAWDDFDEARWMFPDGRVFEIQLYDQAAADRLPAGAMVAGRPLYVVVEEVLD